MKKWEEIRGNSSEHGLGFGLFWGKFALLRPVCWANYPQNRLYELVFMENELLIGLLEAN